LSWHHVVHRCKVVLTWCQPLDARVWVPMFTMRFLVPSVLVPVYGSRAPRTLFLPAFYPYIDATHACTKYQTMTYHMSANVVTYIPEHTLCTYIPDIHTFIHTFCDTERQVLALCQVSAGCVASKGERSHSFIHSFIHTYIHIYIHTSPGIRVGFRRAANLRRAVESGCLAQQSARQEASTHLATGYIGT